ncbi:MAG: hypothetical protein Kow00106_23200 [Anaerolineae bacterium]
MRGEFRTNWGLPVLHLGRKRLLQSRVLFDTNEADNAIAPRLIRQLPGEVRYVLGDTHYNDPELRTVRHLSDRFLVTTRRGRYPHTDGGVDVRRIFHELRSRAIEPFNGLFKNVFEWGDQVPVKGLHRTQLVVLGAILVYQLVLCISLTTVSPLGVASKRSFGPRDL